MAITLSITPGGRILVQSSADAPATTDDGSSLLQANLDEATQRRLVEAFAEGSAPGLLRLATAELQTVLPAALAFLRDLSADYLTRLCHVPRPDPGAALAPIAPPETGALAALAESAPPMRGMEYLSADLLRSWWVELDELTRARIAATGSDAGAFLRELNPLWRTVGRVTFHLAENKRDPDRPFAFLATYATRLSAQGTVQHLALSKALEEYAGAGNRDGLLALLQPIQRAAEQCAWVKELADSRLIYKTLLWTPAQAYRMLRDVPTLEASGLIVRVPNWWKTTRPPRPVVSVKVGDRAAGQVGVGAILDFSVDLTLDGEPLGPGEIQDVLNSVGGLISLKGKWIEVDRDKLAEALGHWKKVERDARAGGISFFEGMRLLAGAVLPSDAVSDSPEPVREWVGISAGKNLEALLGDLRALPATDDAPPGLLGTLRPYQKAGVHWLRFLTRMGLGACLADDMGLGKTITVIALLLHLRHQSVGGEKPSLLVVPASLIANWKSELARFAPSLSALVAHPSEGDAGAGEGADLDRCDLVITTYSMVGRLDWIKRRAWRLVILDEAQAIKNSGTRQARSVKALSAEGRVAMTGTPVENRLSDLWSLFDFLNPGLLGGAKEFTRFARDLAGRDHKPYAPLRALVRPYILRRLKTDKRIIADLPEKTEVNAFCGLSRRQAALYQESVRDLREAIEKSDGIQRRGIVLASLMRLKQICNHPTQLTGQGGWEPEHSGKFQRLAAICQELAERQEKALVFTQFREIATPLADYLAGLFGRPGLVLHGQTPVARRRELVEAFQREDGPPFFVLSLKAGGTGLNLTAASQVIHFDRWWNPAVENQATDRAFRIGQKKNVLVHKFICRGTVEDRIDQMIAEKTGLSRDLLEGGGEAMLTEMSNDQLLRFVALDINQATET